MSDVVEGARTTPDPRTPGIGRRMVRTHARAVAGFVLGVVTALAELGFVAVAGLVLSARGLVLPRGHRPVPGAIAHGAQWLCRVERWRLGTLLGSQNAPQGAAPRALAYLALRAPVGILGGLIVLLIAYGAVAGLGVVVGWLTGHHVDGIPPSGWLITYVAVAGLVLSFLAVQGLVGVVALERLVARRCLGPSPREAYERRIAQLATSRAAVVEAVDDERRRIERDLHDAVQQRLVGLGMLIGRARRAGDGPRSRDLLRQAQEESQHALDDLRDVAWRIYPAALDEAGLRVALENVAERADLPVEIDCDLVARPGHAVETAAYFVVCEAVTNAAKHSGAGRVGVRVEERGTMIHVRIEDDGVGRADPRGGGLSGLARRVAALDGTFAVDSPPGGPTIVTAELPCG